MRVCFWFLSICLLAPPVAIAESNVVIFMYHRFGEDNFPSTSIRTSQFLAQVNELKQGDYAVIPLQQALDFVDGGAELPARAVVLTVDDAYRSVYEVAFPLLQQAGLPFTVFTSTAPLDEGHPGYMSWDQVREMARAGVTFASHGDEHLHMASPLDGESAEQWVQRIAADMDLAQARLTDELKEIGGHLESAFAWPYGEYAPEVAALVKQRGWVAFGQQSGAVGDLSDRLALPRFPMAEAFADMDEFRVKANSLALPVNDIDPWDPRASSASPVLTVRLAGDLPNADQITCFVSRQGQVAVEWLETGTRFMVSPGSPLGAGRHRVNCTLPDEDGRFYWYSHQWLIE